MAEINRRLNIVDEVTTADGGTLYVHSSPIRREVFDQHYMVLTKTISAMYEQNITPMMGSRIALRMMRDIAQSMGDAQTVKLDTLLLPEIWRLTNVLVASPDQGWQMLPFEKAVKDRLIDEDDEDVIRNHLAFFTAASWVHTRKELKDMIYPMMSADTFGSQIVSSTAMDFMRSLPTSTPAENTGVTASQSSTLP